MVNIHLLITGYNISSGSYTVRYIIYIGKANHYKQRTAQTHQHYIYIQIQKWVLLTESFFYLLEVGLVEWKCARN